MLIAVPFSRWGPRRSPCRRGRVSWWSSAAFRQPLSSMRAPTPARVVVRVLIALSVAQPLSSMRGPIPARVSVVVFIAWSPCRSAVGVDGAAAAGADDRGGVHGDHPLSSMRTPAPARTVLWMLISVSSWGVDSAAQPLGSMAAPRPTRTCAVVFMAWLRSLRRWDRWSSRPRGWWSSCAWMPPGQPLSSIRGPAPARTVVVDLICLSRGRWLSRTGRSSTRSRRVPWCRSSSAPHPLGSMAQPTAARRCVLAVICASPHP